MTLLALVAIIFFGFATYNLTCAFVDIPTKKTSRMMMLARKQQGVKSEKLLDVYITKIAGLIAPYLKLDKLKRNKLQRALDIAGLELTPEIYTARAWVTAGAVGLCSTLLILTQTGTFWRSTPRALPRCRRAMRTPDGWWQTLILKKTAISQMAALRWWRATPSPLKPAARC